jgi:hypothetical protein
MFLAIFETANMSTIEQMLFDNNRKHNRRQADHDRYHALRISRPCVLSAIHYIVNATKCETPVIDTLIIRFIDQCYRMPPPAPPTIVIVEQTKTSLY